MDTSGPPYPTVIERYFKRYYYQDHENGHVCVLSHSNKISVLTLAPDHAILKSSVPVKSINFQMASRNYGKAVKGRRKQNAFRMKKGMPLCEVTMEDDTTFSVLCGVRGKMLEVNKNLQNDVSLLKKMHETNGYICVIMHDLQNADFAKNIFTEEEYKSKMAGFVVGKDGFENFGIVFPNTNSKKANEVGSTPAKKQCFDGPDVPDNAIWF